MKKILFTGGGSGGHVTLNLGLIPLFKKAGWEVIYIGSKNGIENELIKKIEDVRYYAIETGKLRRYFSKENFKDAMRVPLGIFQAWKIIRKEKPDVIFSKGGFVSFPVVLGGYLSGCRKIYMHESDVTPGLANKMSLPFVNTFFTTFADTSNYVNHKEKIKYVGPVLTDRLENGNKEKARDMCFFNSDKPVIMFVGGSLGAKSINNAVIKNLETLLDKYQIIHICGKGQTIQAKCDGYMPFEFVDTEFKDLMALADVVVSRSGSNAIFELLSQKKPMLLVPLPSASSRGEQSLNAKSFKKQGFAEILTDDEVSDKLVQKIDEVFQFRNDYIKNMNESLWKRTSNKELFEIIENEQKL
ncbi:MAG: undecaprenyldiphospho-muramoylpentapeptide beta-N-acetylglucosaminyltransferase [Alphaproteobacteria bacterium]|nr:undecaprenyldiphospho-muramoylpentapeptide beta-N-acetylglucosaminyltransferase [Alphaproteobacteria bacterium]